MKADSKGNEVTSCDECEYYHIEAFYEKCQSMVKDIPHIKGIPEWCPLEDKNREFTSRITTYTDAVSYKYKNARCSIINNKLDHNYIQFKIIDNKAPSLPRTSQHVVRNKVVVTELSLSDEGIINLYHSIGMYLKQIKKFKINNK
jgi:hypothetical protein